VADGREREGRAGGEEELPAGRTRRPGGGRKRLAESGPGLAAALEALVSDAVRGDPESPLTWTTRSAEHLAGELTAAGHPCSDTTAWRMLRRMGYTQQSNSRAREGRRHPDRDAQFRHVAARAREHLAAGQPVTSVDAEKKEQVGNYAQGGREWGPAGQPVAVRSHDFPDRDGMHAIPYGVHDEAANAGFVNAGTDGNTAALAAESVRRWRQAVGKDAYPGASRLLVTCGSSPACATTSPCPAPSSPPCSPPTPAASAAAPASPASSWPAQPSRPPPARPRSSRSAPSANCASTQPATASR
jgi:hypothetical protein